MGEIRLYNFCEIRTANTLQKVLKTLKQTGATVIKQYGIPEARISIGSYYNGKIGRNQNIKCCADHERLPKESEITTVIEYISTVTL